MTTHAGDSLAVVLACAGALTAMALPAFADTPRVDADTITSFTVDSGGGSSSGSGFSVSGTLGQPEAGPASAAGSGFSVAGGFWNRAAVTDRLFADDFEP